jgi:hypothetical protein
MDTMTVPLENAGAVELRLDAAVGRGLKINPKALGIVGPTHDTMRMPCCVKPLHPIPRGFRESHGVI